jgi:imidazolonepropionase-like amidohydrolase
MTDSRDSRKPLYIRATMVENGCERDLVISDGVIADAAPIPGAEPDVSAWVLPGLVDLHNHLSLASPVGHAEDADVRVRASASFEMAVGVLALREPGSPDEASTRLRREDGWPTVITAGRFLAPPDGYFPGLARHVTANQLEAAALEERRRSGCWVKIIGDYLGGDRFVPNWSAEVLAKTTARVHAEGGRVAVHAVCPEAVAAAIAAGVDSIEHGWAIRDADFATMRANATAWVPTLMPGGSELACEFAAHMGFSSETLRWMRTVIDAQPATIARAHQAGVVVLAGTDAGQGPHGMLIDQIQLLAAGGVSPRDAVGAASWTGRRYLGLSCIETGAPADLVVYDADPGVDVDVLRRPAMIMLDGRVLRARAAATLAG